MGGGGKSVQSLKILLLRRKEVNAFIPLASVILLTPLHSSAFFLVFPLPACWFLWECCGHPSALGAGTAECSCWQAVPPGQWGGPGCQVQGMEQRRRCTTQERQSHHINGLEPGGIIFFFNSQNPTISFLRTIGVGDKSRMSHGDNSHKLIFQWLIILIHSADKYIHTSTNDLWRKRMPWSYVIEIL